MSDIEDTAEGLLSHFDDGSETSKRVKQIQENDPFMDLKLNLLNFFKDRISQITAQERLKQRIEEEIEAFVERGDLTFEQIMSVYNSVSRQNNSSADSLLGLFKPTPGAPSILADNLAKQEEKKDVFENLYDEFSSEQLEKMEVINRVINTIRDNKNVKDEE